MNGVSNKLLLLLLLLLVEKPKTLFEYVYLKFKFAQFESLVLVNFQMWKFARSSDLTSSRRQPESDFPPILSLVYK